MDQPTDGLGGDGPILYKCPYCVAGRFTKKDGWNEAVRHIRENHMEKRKKRRGPYRAGPQHQRDAAVGLSGSSLFDEESNGE
jgi:hypothetical protein